MLHVSPGQLDANCRESPLHPSRLKNANRNKLNLRSHVFASELVAAMGTAYRTVLAELELPDCENAGTLMVAKRVIEMAARGEHDPLRLAATTLELLSR
jgi:hypothetical protein